MDNAVEVRYAGVVVGRGALREVRAGDADGVFVAVPEPLPVGTLLTLKIGDAVREGRVEDIVESSDANAVGMRVRWGAGAPAAKVAATASTAAPPPAAATTSPQAAAPATPDESADSGPTGDSGPMPTSADAGDDSGAIPAPLSLAGTGGKRRRKRR